jgi:hypothetical protein
LKARVPGDAGFREEKPKDAKNVKLTLVQECICTTVQSEEQAFSPCRTLAWGLLSAVLASHVEII